MSYTRKSPRRHSGFLGKRSAKENEPKAAAGGNAATIPVKLDVKTASDGGRDTSHPAYTPAQRSNA